jgi:hypothetical protein
MATAELLVVVVVVVVLIVLLLPPPQAASIANADAAKADNRSRGNFLILPPKLGRFAAADSVLPRFFH